jgi:hypothetical protein
VSWDGGSYEIGFYSTLKMLTGKNGGWAWFEKAKGSADVPEKFTAGPRHKHEQYHELIQYPTRIIVYKITCR